MALTTGQRRPCSILSVLFLLCANPAAAPAQDQAPHASAAPTPAEHRTSGLRTAFPGGSALGVLTTTTITDLDAPTPPAAPNNDAEIAALKAEMDAIAARLAALEIRHTSPASGAVQIIPLGHANTDRPPRFAVIRGGQAAGGGAT